MALYRYGDHTVAVQINVGIHRDTGATAITIRAAGRIIVALDLSNAEALSIGSTLITQATLPHTLRDIIDQPNHING